MKRTILFGVGFLYSLSLAGDADLIIFPYNRPLQLYALLEWLRVYVKGLEQIMVVYRASDAAYEDAYSKVNPFVKTPNSKKI